ncbi:MerR family transcriptional regulator [Schleiferia thermophila str. Yellowstone]|uniref:helix-turn-helix domain-containing protein n=1 Tax=Schleiferia thermophila TaxID=884107 RepID=UPI0004E750D9|nr:helix-turn-helix transcriptional regulator [Schleiferia thermophila]KFD40048.1 MerR family transcriptional regulator [Schleiferia thermophila str. Yellowstone]
MQLGERIRKIRESQNLTQAEVADRIDITPSAYGQIERKAANSSYHTLQKIALALNVSISFLLDIENPNYIEEKNKL